MRYTRRSSSEQPADTQQKDRPNRAKQRRAAVKVNRKNAVLKGIALYEGAGALKHNFAPDLTAIVQFRTSAEHTWKEVTTALNVSKSGASFLLEHPCEVGRLVSLVISMPVEYRIYDLSEELYRVIGLIQYCHETPSPTGETMYSVGVAFVGKDLPAGYDSNPTQNYHISGTTPSGMWQIKPSSKGFKLRGAARFWVSLDVTITLIQKKRTVDYKLDTVTCNVSASGALVVCRLDVAKGAKVKFACKELEFYSVCVVRDRQMRDGIIPLLHLEFVDNKFPVEKISAPNVTAVTA
jgi:hypothetical protein